MTDTQSPSPKVYGPGNLKVVPHDPAKERRKRNILIVTFLVSVALSYWLGGRISDTEAARLNNENIRLERINKTLIMETEKLIQRVAILERTGQVDKESIKNIRGLIRELEGEKAALAKDLAFFKSILAPENTAQGVRLHELELLPGDAENRFLVRLVVSQVARDNPFLKGTMTVEVDGLSGGKKKTLSLLELSGLDKTQSLGFRYFQAFPEKEDYLQMEIPAGFTPEKIRVAIKVRRGAVKSIVKTYSWDQELASSLSRE
ncbi:hypothetical protein EOPP23_10630 [Endozoicomonas sp. OPT23]|uniref:DUF6776 family protein n=1 Tax=Endozoicomonas sp. OPT23 TaxID=2072845 RepID=UPI00129A62B5|nr:DUF6776 family protein [Endozoicomonas sp. OPT23]MRI33440.1 hypothetical protein [Endozoicomonas sp. OPT23]